MTLFQKGRLGTTPNGFSMPYNVAYRIGIKGDGLDYTRLRWLKFRSMEPFLRCSKLRTLRDRDALFPHSYFVLILEPFLSRVRKNPSIGGLSTSPGIHKVAAYADNMLFLVIDPDNSFPAILVELRAFGRLSNLKIHFDKLEILDINVESEFTTL